MLHYRKSTLIDAPVEVVWNFHERPDILERLTPPWQPVQVVRREGGLDVGAISEFRLFFGLPPSGNANRVQQNRGGDIAIRFNLGFVPILFIVIHCS